MKLSQMISILIQVHRVSQIGGDVASRGPAIYLHILKLPDNTWYWYVGQAHDLWNRIHSQHRDFRYRRDNPSLHYYAHDRSMYDRFVVLADLDDFPRPTTSSNIRLILNLLEMWCCLLFRCLPAQTLNTWLHEEDFYDISFDGPVRSLNVALPLDMGDGLASSKAFELLKESPDELARQYHADVRKGGILRPKAVPRPRKKIVDITTTSVSTDRFDVAMGVFIGVFGTLGLILVRRAFWGPASRVFRTSK
jgi:hypothetical protein